MAVNDIQGQSKEQASDCGVQAWRTPSIPWPNRYKRTSPDIGDDHAGKQCTTALALQEMEEHESPIATPPPTHYRDTRPAIVNEDDDNDDEREAQELQEVNVNERASTTENHAATTARQSARIQRPPRCCDGIRRWWAGHIAATVPHDACRDHLGIWQSPVSGCVHGADQTTPANERTFLGYLRTSLALSMLGIVIAQLFRLQHTIDPSKTFGYFILGKPLAAVLECVAMATALIGAHRFWRQQMAMMRGKCLAGGWEIVAIGVGVIVVSRLVILKCRNSQFGNAEHKC